MAEADTRSLQRQLNFFTKKYLLGYAPLRVDGRMGRLTRKRIRVAKFYLGYEGPLTSSLREGFLSRLYHPKSLRYSSPARLRLAARRRSKERRAWKRNHRVAVRTTGVGTYDGRPCSNIGIRYLEYARSYTGPERPWEGTLQSGWRDPVYSEGLCIKMCGRPSCPGRCAGRNSNHSGTTAARFALDVSDYVRFGEIMRSCPLQPPIFNALGAIDPVHFSPSGN